ncbi:MAG: YraN family protein [Ignavibacteriales bacterium]|nr:YraN family protein [Ignavibacteriales bacterium]MBK7980387.1 YraN family protein [Ignavibacteriota bacterium]
MDNKKDIGNYGEKIATDFLVEKGFEIIEQNYHFGHGEIDIIAKEKDILVFVEVKTRKNLEFGDPILAVTKNKQRQLKKIAEAYLYEKEIKNTDCRIDVIGILLNKNLPPKITYIENAF